MELTTCPQKQLIQSYDQKKEKSANKMELTTCRQTELIQSYDQKNEKYLFCPKITLNPQQKTLFLPYSQNYALY